MFSASGDKVGYGVSHYQWRTDISTVINELFRKYRKEGIVMPYTIDDYRRERKEEFLRSLTREDVSGLLGNLSPEERLRGLSPEEVFKAFPPEERLRGLSPEEVFKAFPPEERLRGLSEEEIEACLKILRLKRQKNSD